MARPELYKSHPYLPLATVIIGNIIPLFGVLFYSWNLFDIFYLYWIENLFIGMAVILRMLMVSAAWGIGTLIGSLFSIAFFTVHYGGFCFGHGMILFEIFYDGSLNPNKNPADIFLFIFERDQTGFLWAIGGIALVVIVETLKHIYEDKKDAKMPDAIMMSPYGRIILLHLTIILGGLLAQIMGSPVWALAFLITLKILYDMAVITDKTLLKDKNNKHA